MFFLCNLGSSWPGSCSVWLSSWSVEEVLALIALTEVLAHTMIAAHARILSDVILYTELYKLQQPHGHPACTCICSEGTWCRVLVQGRSTSADAGARAWVPRHRRWTHASCESACQVHVPPSTPPLDQVNLNSISNSWSIMWRDHFLLGLHSSKTFRWICSFVHSRWFIRVRSGLINFFEWKTGPIWSINEEPTKF